jgi:hypothetical protein
VQPVSVTHTFDPVIFLSCLQVVFPALTAFRVRIFRCLLFMNIFLMISFSAFSDLVDLKYWDCLHFRFSSAL